jgi:hypothetical protein
MSQPFSSAVERQLQTASCDTSGADNSLLGPKSGLSQNVAVAKSRADTEGIPGFVRCAIKGQCLSWLYRRRFLYAVLQECRSLIGRIEMLYNTNLAFRDVHWAPRVGDRNVHCRTDIDVYARMRDIQQMLANHPWATRLDQVLFLAGWDKGERAGSCKTSSSLCRTLPKEDTT